LSVRDGPTQRQEIDDTIRALETRLDDLNCTVDLDLSIERALQRYLAADGIDVYSSTLDIGRLQQSSFDFCRDSRIVERLPNGTARLRWHRRGAARRGRLLCRLDYRSRAEPPARLSPLRLSCF
jgi:hypothetical protein